MAPASADANSNGSTPNSRVKVCWGIVKDLAVEERARAIGFVKYITRRPSRQREATCLKDIALRFREGASARRYRKLTVRATFIVPGKFVRIHAWSSPVKGRGIEANTCSSARLGVGNQRNILRCPRRVRRGVSETEDEA